MGDLCIDRGAYSRPHCNTKQRRASLQYPTVYQHCRTIAQFRAYPLTRLVLSGLDTGHRFRDNPCRISGEADSSRPCSEASRA